MFQPTLIWSVMRHGHTREVYHSSVRVIRKSMMSSMYADLPL